MPSVVRIIRVGEWVSGCSSGFGGLRDCVGAVASEAVPPSKASMTRMYPLSYPRI